jgi:hypothetical protein
VPSASPQKTIENIEYFYAITPSKKSYSQLKNHPGHGHFFRSQDKIVSDTVLKGSSRTDGYSATRNVSNGTERNPAY